MWIFSKYGAQNRNIQRNFLLGERALRAYLAGGNVRFLKDAETNLSVIGPNAKQYRDARFYLGVTKAQLRKASESIEILKDLQQSASLGRGGRSNRDFANRVALQLAYAHIKTYTDEGYKNAGGILDALVLSADEEGSAELLLQAKSLQAFLYSVMLGYSTLEEQKREFAVRAREIAEEVLTNPRSSQGVRFEALNALGITWMRVAEKNWHDSSDRSAAWTKSQEYFDEAITVLPNSVRVLQNMATLRLIQVRQDAQQDRFKLLKEAKDLVNRSLEINDQDQFPFYQLAQIAVLQKDKKLAIDAIREGRNRSGAVKEKQWVAVETQAETL